MICSTANYIESCQVVRDLIYHYPDPIYNYHFALNPCANVFVPQTYPILHNNDVNFIREKRAVLNPNTIAFIFEQGEIPENGFLSEYGDNSPPTNTRHFLLNPHAEIFIPREQTWIGNMIINSNVIPYSHGQTNYVTVVTPSIPDNCPYTLNYSTISKQKFILNPSADIFIVEHRHCKISKSEVKNKFTHPIMSLLNPKAKIFTPYPYQTYDNYNELSGLSMFNDTPSVHDQCTPKEIISENFDKFDNSILNITPVLHEISTPALSEGEFGESDNCETPILHQISTPVLSEVGIWESENGVESICSSDEDIIHNGTLLSQKYMSEEFLDKNDIDHQEVSQVIRQIRGKNMNRVIIGHLNINFMAPKLDAIRTIIPGNVDINSR